MSHKPELLAPAKNLERLKVAILYGADAVYVGGQKYGLRARADNFTDTELETGVRFAHARDAKVFVTLNAFLHDEDFEGLAEYCGLLEDVGADAVIVSDLGVLQVVRRSSSLAVHLSTQASCLNVYAARLWKELGARRIILGRELTIAEAGYIQREADVDVELFIHGAMCMSYSGHCTISNFTAGRDSNRGGCSQSCRFPYAVEEVETGTNAAAEPLVATSDVPAEGRTATFMSSRDLWGIYQMEDFFAEGIRSVKIEGRMKSSFYTATTCQAYRQLLDACENGQLCPTAVARASELLQAVPHRDYFTGSLQAPASVDSVFHRLSGTNTGSHKYVGLVQDVTSDRIVVRIFTQLKVGDTIEWMPFQESPLPWTIDELFTITGQPIRSMRQDNVVSFPRRSELDSVQRFNVVRMAES